MDKKEFRTMMAILFTTYRQDVDVSVSDAYYMWIKNYSLKEFKSAVYSIVKKLKYFPSVSEIIGEIVGEPIPEVIVKADIIREIKNTGTYGAPVLEHDISQAVVNDVGWSNLCKMSDKELHDTVHFRYLEVADMWKACGLEGRTFLVEHKAGRIGGGPKGGLKGIKQLVAETIGENDEKT